jgi:hypothetical protein
MCLVAGTVFIQDQPHLQGLDSKVKADLDDVVLQMSMLFPRDDNPVIRPWDDVGTHPRTILYIGNDRFINEDNFGHALARYSRQTFRGNSTR